jgi:uncharacterized protein involved in response to NO
MSQSTSQSINQSDPKTPFWQIAFRPFFLIPSLFMAIALTVWGLLLTQSYPASFASYQPYAGWIGWHSHEMIFGFVQGIAIGFLLTASRNWAGQPGISANMLRLLVSTWLIARIAWFIPTTPILLIICLDTLTPLIAALGLAKTLHAGEKDKGKGSQKHNWPFVLLLFAFALVQILFHLLSSQYSQYVSLLMQAAVLMMAGMTLWVSGRVLPFFTKARLLVPITPLPNKLKPVSMIASWSLIPLLVMSTLFSDAAILKWLLAVTAIVAALTHALILKYTFKAGVKNEPMLWSLYLAYAWIIVGYILLAMNQLTGLYVNWLHSITIGGLFGMILSMMARISLGHTGRKITALKGISIAFILVQLATLTRIGLVSALGANVSFVVSIGLVLVAMVIFLYHYSGILIRPRADGRPD